MNANEIIANRAIELLGGEKGDYRLVHPNDHVNMARSTNDVIPTAGKITVLKLASRFGDTLELLHEALFQKPVEFSHALKSSAIMLSKLTNDIRLLSSGPLGGFGEINISARQNRSSIMPGKVNPVIPELLNQSCFLVIGHDTVITMASEAGQCELNAFELVSGSAKYSKEHFPRYVL